ncbi:hypothetical protein AAULR_17504, partial [Lacticaseibacillus rhamnosus MTCC 5462]
FSFIHPNRVINEQTDFIDTSADGFILKPENYSRRLKPIGTRLKQ